MTGTELILPDGSVVPVRDNRAGRPPEASGQTVGRTGQVMPGHPVEVRDPKGATQTIGWTSPTLPQVEEWDGAAAWRLGVCANVIAYRCVQIRANAGAKIPLVAGTRLGDATTIRPNAPIARLLGPPPGGPAPKLSARKLIRWTFAQEIVTGRRAWEIETVDGTVDGTPVAFWPLASAHLRAIASASGNDWFRLFHYGRYHDPVKLPPGLVFYGWSPSGTDFRQAESPLQAARFDLSLVNLCDRYGIGFLRNNAVPAAVITTTAFPDDVSRRRFMDNWQHEFGGPDNSGRIALREVESDDGEGSVGESIDVKVLGLSAKDARLTEMRKDLMVEIAVALGTPWSKLDASGRTFDNASVEDTAWHHETILPALMDLQDDINMQLAPRLGDEVVWFDLREVPAFQRRIVPITQTVGAPSLVQAQLMTINEARIDYGLVPTPDGDRMMTADEIVALRGGGGGEPARAAIEPERREIEPPSALPSASERAPESPESRETDPEAVEARRALLWRTADAVATSIERRWEKALRRLFRRQGDAVVARLTGKRGRQMLERRDVADPLDVEDLFSIAFWVAETTEVVDDLYGQAAGAALDRIALTFGIDFDLQAPWVAEFIATRANLLAGQVTQTTYDAITAQLVEGVDLGESIDDLATRIRAVFTQATDTRSTMIARTEVISAYNGAAVGAVETLPRDVVMAQEWLATRDSRTRDSHASADGQVQLIGQPFVVGGHVGAYPGDPALPSKETVHCRCSVAFLTPDEFAALERSPRQVEVRAAKAMLALVPFGDEFDLLGWRRALEEVA